MVSKFVKYLHSNIHSFVKITSINKKGNLRFFYTTRQNFGAGAGPKGQGACGSQSQLEKNMAAVLYSKNDVRIEDRPIPKINEDQVLIEVEVVGVGLSDSNFVQNATITQPIIIGHEASGTVVECGKNVKKLEPGDRVAIEPYVGCKKCYACKTGRYNLCKKVKYCSHPPHNGILCRYHAHDADSCFKLPCNLDFEHGCLIQPLSMVVHAVQRAGLEGKDMVLISGASTLGLLGVLVAKACVPKVVVIDRNEYNLKKAMELGSACAINIKGIKPKDVRKQVEEAVGKLPNKGLDCSGDEEMIQMNMCSIRSAGQVTLVKLGKNFMSLPLQELYWRMTNLIGSYRSCNDYPRSIHMLNSENLDPKVLVTHHFKLEETGKAFALMCQKTEPFLKIMIHCNPKWNPTC